MRGLRRARRSPTRVAPGAAFPRRSLLAISGETIGIPDSDRVVHLQLRRFAGCPICNLHLESFVRRHDELVAAGIREIVVFHSSIDDLRRHQADLPFAVVADPDRSLYVELGVEAAARALLDPRAWPAVLRGGLGSIRGLARGKRPPPILPAGGPLGLPADFMVGTDGRLLASKYGAHADDHWSVDDVLQRARARQPSPQLAR